MKDRHSGAVPMFIGILLTVIFIVGLMADHNPQVLSRRYHYDYALEQFKVFCSAVCLPAGVIGIPLFLVSLILSLVREKKGKE